MAFVSLAKQDLYELMTEYFDNPAMVKIRNDAREYSVYGIQVPCMLLNEKRYLIALCPYDVVSLHNRKPLRDLSWMSLQVRALNDESFAHLPVHRYEVKRDDRFMIPLHIFFRSTKISTYRDPSSRIEVSLLHQRNIEYEYPNEGNLVSALETYQTIVQFISSS